MLLTNACEGCDGPRRHRNPPAFAAAANACVDSAADDHYPPSTSSATSANILVAATAGRVNVTSYSVFPATVCHTVAARSANVAVATTSYASTRHRSATEEENKAMSIQR